MSGLPSRDKVEIAPEIAATLAGRRFGLFGFDSAESSRIAELLGRMGSLSTRFEENWLADSVHLGDAVIIKLEALRAPLVRTAAACSTPALIVSTGESVLAGAGGAYHWSRDFVAEPWSDAELLVRLFRLVAPSRAAFTRENWRSRPLVLLADDDTAWTLLVEAALRNRGLDCETAVDGLTAVQVARQRLPDILMLDVKMPAMDGFAVLQTLRSEPLLDRLPIALLTACMNEEEVQRGAALGADDYIVKPVTPTVLMNRIKRLLTVAAARKGGADRPAALPPQVPSGPANAGPPDAKPEMADEFEHLRAQYVENRTLELATLADALRRADFEALARAGHNLKGTGAAYGFVELSELGKALEAAAKGQDASQVEAVLGKTESYLSLECSSAQPK